MLTVAIITNGTEKYKLIIHKEKSNKMQQCI